MNTALPAQSRLHCEQSVFTFQNARKDARLFILNEIDMALGFKSGLRLARPQTQAKQHQETE